jgi:hypothetical protein
MLRWRSRFEGLCVTGPSCVKGPVNIEPIVAGWGGTAGLLSNGVPDNVQKDGHNPAGAIRVTDPGTYSDLVMNRVGRVNHREAFTLQA